MTACDTSEAPTTAKAVDRPVIVAEVADVKAPLLVMAEVVPAAEKWQPRSFLVWAWHGCWWFAEQVFGWFCSLLGLSLLATIPIAQFITLGYMLECSGRIARKGRFRD